MSVSASEITIARIRGRTSSPTSEIESASLKHFFSTTKNVSIGFIFNVLCPTLENENKAHFESVFMANSSMYIVVDMKIDLNESRKTHRN